MSLKYGLNVKKKGPPPPRRTLLDDEDGDEDEPQQSGPPETAIEEITTFGGSSSRSTPQSKPAFGLTKPKPKKPPKRLDDDDDSRQDLSASRAAQNRVKEAQQADSAIFDYDSFHDAKTSVTEAKKAAQKEDAIARKPKYINNLLESASRRKQDQQIAKEKLLQKEREADGDEFADKEKFVTGAYKAQQEETRKLEEEEKRKAEEEAKRRGNKLVGGMAGFYRTMMDQSEKQHQEAVEAAEKAEKEGVQVADDDKKKTDAELAEEAKARGKNIHINEEGQITDKRELLTAGLNVAPSGKGSDRKGADHLKSSNRPAQSAFPSRNKDTQQATRERQSRMMEEQIAERQKRQREEEEEERAKLEKAAKSTKTETDVSDAKARYLARKAAKEKEKAGE
ncbi:Putative nuclear speckle splicing regulatory protein [Septoria linicola]|uniref:Nuclear speckle splicing regulatory protein n=1 Tax=Septoria linicola TaxID=215465 RepID=A0A9Q9AV21_9PEZI|nr:putative nuclear speckle splicing regulatory protein [Septoria linicola]USW52401.1 Putative nuclear speckle splicing regulatory protein [Septoria linicola]